MARAEFDRVIQNLNERGRILDDIRHNLDLQFHRIAQMQAQIDHLIARRARRPQRSKNNVKESHFLWLRVFPRRCGRTLLTSRGEAVRSPTTSARLNSSSRDSFD